MLGERTDRIYLSVGYGRIRKKCKPGDPGAVERETKNGTVYAVEYSFLSGALEGIKYRTSEEFGNSWVVDVVDGKQHYRLQIPEQSRECVDLLKRIPNLQQYQFYKFTPYDIKEKGKKGLSIKDQTDTPVPSFYQTYEKFGDGWNVTNTNGFPDPDFETRGADKDDWRAYFIKVNKFLRVRSLEILSSWGGPGPEAAGSAPAEHIEDPDPDPIPGDVSDLPF